MTANCCRVCCSGIGRLWHCAPALVCSLVQLPVRFPCVLCGVLRGLLGSSGAHFPGWFGGPFTWRSAHTVAGPAVRCGDCWWCHDEAHRAQHHRSWGVEFRRPCQVAVPVGVPFLPTCFAARVRTSCLACLQHVWLRLPVLGSSFLYLLAVDSLDVLNPRNSKKREQIRSMPWPMLSFKVQGKWSSSGAGARKK